MQQPREEKLLLKDDNPDFRIEKYLYFRANKTRL